MKTRSLAVVKPKMKRKRKSAFPKQASLPGKKAAVTNAVESTKKATKERKLDSATEEIGKKAAVTNDAVESIKMATKERKLDSANAKTVKKGLCCSNCKCEDTPLWRMIDNKTVCNACGLRYKRHGTFQDMKKKKDGTSKIKRGVKKAKTKHSDQKLLRTCLADRANSNLGLDEVHSAEYTFGPCDTKELLKDLHAINRPLDGAEDSQAEFTKALTPDHKIGENGAYGIHSSNLQKEVTEMALQASDLRRSMNATNIDGAGNIRNVIIDTNEQGRADVPAIGQAIPSKKPVACNDGKDYYESDNESESGSCETISPEKMRIACYPRQFAESLPPMGKVVSFFKSNVPLLGYSASPGPFCHLSQANTLFSPALQKEDNELPAAARNLSNPSPFCKRIQRAALREELKSVQLAIKRIDAEIQRRKRAYEDTFAGVLFERLRNFSPSEQSCPAVEGTFNADLRTLLKNFSFPYEERESTHAWDSLSSLPQQMPVGSTTAQVSLFTQFFESSKTVHFDSPLLAKEAMISNGDTTTSNHPSPRKDAAI